MTTDDLRALLAKATPGPWEWRREKLISVGDSTTVINYADYEGMWFVSYEGRNDANKEILIAAVNALPGLLDRLEAAEADAVVWRHIAQERYADFRRAVDPKETGYPVDGALDSLFNAYRKTGKFNQVFCSQCGGAFPSNYHGYSHCTDHAAIDAVRGTK